MTMGGLKRQIYLVDKEAQGEFFKEMILPNVWDKINDPAVFLIGVLEDTRVIGAAVLRLENGRAQLLSIAVEASRRRQGIGSALLRACVRILRRTSIQTLYTVLMEAETEAESLVSAFGMVGSEAASAHYSILLKDVAALKVLQNGGNKTYALEDVPDLMLSRFMNTVFSADAELGKRELFEPRVSRLLIENTQITACLFMEKVESGLSIAWLSSKSKNKLAVLYMIQEALAAAIAEYPEDTNISFTAYDTLVLRLADELLGNAAEKYAVREWVLEGYSFRLKDTSPMEWEEI